MGGGLTVDSGAVLVARDLPVVPVQDEGAGALLLGAHGAEEFTVAQLDGHAVVGFGEGVGTALWLAADDEARGVEDLHTAGAVGEQDGLAGVPHDPPRRRPVRAGAVPGLHG
ncbi:hypothetical protein GCM10027162_72620 [Streptomyces incanus]